MNKIVCLLVICFFSSFASGAEPLRIFLRGGKKSHGPGAHEHEQFLKDWTALLGERGMKVKGGMDFPDATQLANTDVLLMYAQDGGNIPADKRPGLDQFLKRGGGIVVIHTASVSADSAHWKSIIGGAPGEGTTQKRQGAVGPSFSDPQH